MGSLEIISSLISISAAGILQSPKIKLHALAKRTTCAILFLIPLGLVTYDQSFGKLEKLGLLFTYHERITILVCMVTVLIGVADYFAAGSKANVEHYPPMRATIWTPRLLAKSILAWIIYLVCYEMVFRGVFFFASIEIWGIAPAVILNTAVYSIAHLIKAKREAIVSIPLGLIMCYITWAAGNFWYAAFLHAALAIVHEIASIKANPSMRFEFTFTSIKTICQIKSKR